MIRKKERQYLADRKKEFFDYDFSDEDGMAFNENYIKFVKSCIRQESIKEVHILNPSKGGEIDWFLEKLHFFDRSVKNAMGVKGSLKILGPSEVTYLMDNFRIFVDDETNYVLSSNIDYSSILKRAKKNENQNEVSLVKKMMRIIDDTARCILCEADQGEVIHFLPDLLKNLNSMISEHKSDLQNVFGDCEVYIK